MQFESEEKLHSAMEQWFNSIELPFQSQFQTPVGSLADIAFFHSHSDNAYPWALVEVKNGLSVKDTSVADFAQYFEQCFKYRISTGLPVFLGPFFIPSMGVAPYMSGGANPRHLCAAFSAIAGRTDVGMLFIHAEPGYELDTKFWYGMRMTLRQKTVVYINKEELSKSEWPVGALDMVSLGGAASSKVRI
jgi:hypothetical protein